VKTLWIDHLHPFFPEWVALRQRVLRDPLGLHYSDEDLIAEQGDRHLVGFVGKTLSGGLVVSSRELPSDTLRIRQVAVEDAAQGMGIGRDLMLEAITRAREDGIQQILLHSRAPVIPFYEKLGFVSEGETFYEVGIPHRRMTLRLDRSS
tara:strand:+ start:2743 stop:3189 length:447 start_codon:yes stop_codon:yes gene_type:complete